MGGNRLLPWPPPTDRSVGPPRPRRAGAAVRLSHHPRRMGAGCARASGRQGARRDSMGCCRPFYWGADCPGPCPRQWEQGAPHGLGQQRIASARVQPPSLAPACRTGGSQGHGQPRRGDAGAVLHTSVSLRAAQRVRGRGAAAARLRWRCVCGPDRGARGHGLSAPAAGDPRPCVGRHRSRRRRVPRPHASGADGPVAPCLPPVAAGGAFCPCGTRGAFCACGCGLSRRPHRPLQKER